MLSIFTIGKKRLKYRPISLYLYILDTFPKLLAGKIPFQCLQ